MPDTIPENCPYDDCGKPIKHVPAGVSKKTGKPYGEFWSCSNYECDFTWRPSKTQGRPKTTVDTPSGSSNSNSTQEHRDIYKGILELKKQMKHIETFLINEKIDPPARQNPYEKEE